MMASQIDVYAKTLKDVKANAANIVAEQAAKGVSVSRMDVRKTGMNGLSAYVAEITFEGAA